MTAHRWVGAVIGSSFLARVCLIVGLKTYAHPRLFEYEAIIGNILAGNGFVTRHIGDAVYKSLNNPLYSYLCAFIYAITGHSYFAVMVVQSLVSVALGFVIYAIGTKLFGERVGLWSAIVTVFHPGLFYYDIYTLIPMSIDTFLIASTVLLFLRFMEDPGVLRIFWVGACIGVGVLSRSMIGAIAPLAALYILLFLGKTALRRKLGMIAVLVAGVALLIAPWLVRNYIVHQKFVFIMSTSGEALWRGNNALATGTSLSRDGRPILQLWPAEFRERVGSLDELGQKEFFENEAKEYIGSHPMAVVKLYLRKLYYFWWFSPQSGTEYRGAYLRIYRVYYVVLIALAAAGFVMAATRGRVDTRNGAWLIFFVIIAIGMFQSVFYVEGRHRWLVEPLIAVLAGGGLDGVMAAVNRKRHYA